MNWMLLFLIVGFIVTTILSEKDEGWWAAVTLIGLLVVYEFLIERGTFNSLFQAIINDPWIIVASAFLWVLIGLFWSFYKWYLFLKEQRGSGVKTALMKGKVLANGKGDPFYEPNEISLTKNKSRIITWMIYWPFSVAWFIIHDPITRLYNWVYEKASGTYERIKDSVFK